MTLKYSNINKKLYSIILLSIILINCVSCNVKKNEYEYNVHSIIYASNVEVDKKFEDLKLIIDNDINLNIELLYDILYMAIWWDKIDIVKNIFKNYNIDINYRNDLGRTFLMNSRTEEMAMLLLNNGADPNLKDCYGVSTYDIVGSRAKDVIENSSLYEKEANNKNYETYYENSMYKYKIYDNNYEVFYEGEHNKEIIFNYISDKIIGVYFSEGNANQSIYFDIYNKKTSNLYENTLYVDDDLIAYATIVNGEIEIVISDIFDNDKIYKTIKREFVDTAVPYYAVESFRRINKNFIEISYINTDYKEIIDVVQIF